MISGAGAGTTAADISNFMNPYTNDVINTTLADVDQQDAMQRRNYTASEAAQSGLGGSGYWIGNAQLAGDQAQARNKTIADLRNTGWNTALGAAQADKTRGLTAGQSMANLANMTSQLGYTDAQAKLAAGNQQQAQQQSQNDASSQNALNKQLWPMQQAQWAASLASGIGPLMGGTTSSSGQASQSQGKGIGNIIGGGLTLASMASDERVKEDVREVGRTHDGQPIYSFRYKGDPRTQMGLMAQDVEQGEHPEAVSEGPGGVKMVNYDAALQHAGRAERPRAADGGPMGIGNGLMGWSDLRPAQVRWPDVPETRPPAAEKDPAGEWEQMAAMGKKAGSGLGNLSRMIDPAGGWAAQTVPTASLGAGGVGGGLSSLASLFGFADGGGVGDYEPTDEEMAALEQVESGGRDIVNPKSGAFGPRQIMPATARDPGFGVRPLDPAGGIPEQRRFSNDYMQAMLARYKGDREAARIAYNGGPARADKWISAGRDDSVIPRESADYYKKIAGRLGEGGEHIVAKAISGGDDGTNFEGAPGTVTAPTGQPYQSKADATTGGFIKKVFGVDFNPLNLTEPERKAMMVAGLSMLSSGDVGRGGLAGMSYLSGVEATERETRAAQAKMAMEARKDEREFDLKNRAENRQERQLTNETGFKERELGLNLDKFNQNTKDEAAKMAWDREKQALDAGKPSEDMKEYTSYSQQELAAGRTPKSFFDYQIELKAAGRPSTNVSVMGDRKGAEEMAKLHAKTYDALRTNASNADSLTDQLDMIEKGVNSGIQTGFAGEGIQLARKLGAALGMADINKVAAGEVVQQVSNKLALMVRAPGGESGGMPGAMSDADRQFLKETVPGLLTTPEGNRQIISIMRAASDRHKVIFDMAVDYAKDHDGQLDAGFDRQMRDYIRANPLSNAVKESLDKPRPVTTTTVPGAPAGGGFKVLRVQ